MTPFFKTSKTLNFQKLISILSQQYNFFNECLRGIDLNVKIVIKRINIPFPAPVTRARLPLKLISIFAVVVS